jgi:hypothetical protein
MYQTYQLFSSVLSNLRCNISRMSKYFLVVFCFLHKKECFISIRSETIFLYFYYNDLVERVALKRTHECKNVTPTYQRNSQVIKNVCKVKVFM